MKQLLEDKSGLMLTPVFWVSRVSSAIAGPWSRGFPPLNSWPCPSFFTWDQGWINLASTVLFWAAVIVVCVLAVKRLLFTEKTQSQGFSSFFQPRDELRQRCARGEILLEGFGVYRKDVQS